MMTMVMVMTMSLCFVCGSYEVEHAARQRESDTSVVCVNPGLSPAGLYSGNHDHHGAWSVDAQSCTTFTGGVPRQPSDISTDKVCSSTITSHCEVSVCLSGCSSATRQNSGKPVAELVDTTVS